MEAAGSTLLILGAVSMIAALVGGSLKLLGNTEFPPLKSPSIRILLGLVGVVFLCSGLSLVVEPNVSYPPTSDPAGNHRDDPRETASSPSADVVAYITAVDDICTAKAQEIVAGVAALQGGVISEQDYVGGMANIHSAMRMEVNNVTRPSSAVKGSLNEILTQLDTLATESAAAYRAYLASDRVAFGQHLDTFERAANALRSAFRNFGLKCPY